MESERKTMRKIFPNLTDELECEENRVRLGSIRTDAQRAEKRAGRQRFEHYVPEVIDFLRRCDTIEQAEEIITYLEKKREIEREYACRLREQLRKHGLRSFGSKKERDYYITHGEL